MSTGTIMAFVVVPRRENREILEKTEKAPVLLNLVLFTTKKKLTVHRSANKNDGHTTNHELF